MNFIFSVENRYFYHAVLKTNLLAPKKYNNKKFSQKRNICLLVKNNICVKVKHVEPCSWQFEIKKNPIKPTFTFPNN